MPNLISTLAERVLWDGEGAISFRDQKQLSDHRNPSIVGDSSVAAGDEWSVAYLREESFKQLVKADRQTKKAKPLKFINRFRRYRVFKHVSRFSSTTAPSSSTTVSNNDSLNETSLSKIMRRQDLIETKDSAKEENPDDSVDDTLARPDLFARLSVRTTRQQADGTSLLQKQHGKRFKAGEILPTEEDDSDESVARSISRAMHDAHFVRKVSELTLGSREGLTRRADWGDPLMTPLHLFGSYDSEDDDGEEQYLFLDDTDDLDVFSVVSDPGSRKIESDPGEIPQPIPMHQRMVTDSYLFGLNRGGTAPSTLMHERVAFDLHGSALETEETTRPTVMRRGTTDSYVIGRRTPSIYLQLWSQPTSLTPMSTTSGTSSSSQLTTENFEDSPVLKKVASLHLTKSPSRRTSVGLEMLDRNWARKISQLDVENSATEGPDE